MMRYMCGRWSLKEAGVVLGRLCVAVLNENVRECLTQKVPLGQRRKGGEGGWCGFRGEGIPNAGNSRYQGLQAGTYLLFWLRTVSEGCAGQEEGACSSTRVMSHHEPAQRFSFSDGVITAWQWQIEGVVSEYRPKDRPISSSLLLFSRAIVMGASTTIRIHSCPAFPAACSVSRTVNLRGLQRAVTSALLKWVLWGLNNGPKDVHVLILGTSKSIPLQGKGTLQM